MSHTFNKHLVFQSDFGIADGAVSAMTGVVVSVDDSLRMHHLTHDIPPYDIYLASYRLYQTYSYWPKGTIFAVLVICNNRCLKIRLNCPNYLYAR